MVSVSAWAADLSQPTVTDVEAAALLVWGSLLHLLPGKMSPLAEVTAEFSPIEIHHKKKIISTELFCERQKAASLKDLFMFPMRSKCRPGAVAGERLCTSLLPLCSLSQVTWQNFPTSSCNTHGKLKAHGRYKGFLWYFAEKLKAAPSSSPFRLSKSTLLGLPLGVGITLGVKCVPGLKSSSCTVCDRAWLWCCC